MLWLRVNRREEFPEPEIRTQAVENSRSVFALAGKLFSDCVIIPREDYAEVEKKTRDAICPGVTVVKGALSFQNCHAVFDYLKVLEDGALEIYMVKSAAHVSALSREDLAYQYYVACMAGYRVKKCAALYVNRDYILTEEDEASGNVRAKGFFREVDLLKEARKHFPKVRSRIAAFRIYTANDKLPGRTLSAGCFSPYDCSLFLRCAEGLPEENVFRLAKTPLDDKIRFYREGRIAFNDFLGPDGNVIPGLSDAAALQILSELEKRPLQADREAVGNFLKELPKTLAYLDFEAFQPVVPLYKGTRPMDTIVFQYSLDIEEPCENAPKESDKAVSADSASRTFRHLEFLADPSKDPRRAAAEALLRDIPEDAGILTYNASYEKKRIAELANLFPELSDGLLDLRGRVLDLMPLFEKKQVYDRRMRGSYSLKNVLPALFPDDPELDYRNLTGVHQGQEAADAFIRLGSLQGEEKEELRSEMLRYCALDTFAMVKIVGKLRKLVEKQG